MNRLSAVQAHSSQSCLESREYVSGPSSFGATLTEIHRLQSFYPWNQRLALDDSKDVLVMFFAPWCGRLSEQRTG